MKQLSNKHLRQALRHANPQPSLPDAGVFWARFRGRAALVHQTAASEAGHRAIAWLPRLGLAAVTSLAVILLVVTLELPQQLLLQSPMPAALSKVDSVDVFVDYSTVMIVEDTENQGTVIWLAGMTPGNDS